MISATAAPMWFAFPPEVHSAQLSAGPGPGPLLSASAAWTSLSVEYAETAAELSAVLAAVESGAWQGPSALSYVAAHGPYLAWLNQQSLNSAALAAEQQGVALAYSTALAGMPTLGELAANHATHAVLVGTNFFGINTIPIALNEADYSRMWVQAATMMAVYDTTAAGAVSASPPAEPAPTIMTASAAPAEAAAEPAPQQPPSWFTDLQNFLYGFLGQPGSPEQNVPLYNSIMEFFNSIGLGNVTDPFGDFFAGLNGLLPWLPLHGEWLWMTGNPFSYLNPGFFAYILSVPLDPGSFIAFTTKVIIDDLLLILYTAVTNPAALIYVAPLAMVEMVGSTFGNVVQVLNYLVTQTALLPALVPLLASPMLLAPPAVLGGLGIGAAAAKLAPAVVPPMAPAPPP
ncbi:PPE family protein, partial [Mycolicibacillus trivialis]